MLASSSGRSHGTCLFIAKRQTPRSSASSCNPSVYASIDILDTVVDGMRVVPRVLTVP